MKLRMKDFGPAMIPAGLFIVILLVLLFSAGCQPTPEAPVVIQKDLEQMLETAQTHPAEAGAQPADAPAPALPLRERTQAPAHIEWETTLAGGKLTIRMDAPVLVPDVQRVPIYRAQTVDFTLEQARQYVEALFPDTSNLVQQRSEHTKEELMALIVHYEYLKTLEDNAGEQDQNELDERIANIQAQLPTAPDTVDYVPFDGTFKQHNLADDQGQIMGGYASMYVGEKEGQGGADMRIQNNDTLEKGIIDADGMGGRPPTRGARLAYDIPEQSRRNYQYLFRDMTLVEDGFAVPEEAKDALRLTPEGARAQAEALLQRMGITDLTWAFTTLTDDEAMGNYDGIVRDAEHWAYNVVFLRDIGGIPTAVLEGAANDASDANGMMGVFNGQWYYEYAKAMVDDTGIFQMEWCSPHALTEQVTEDSALLPFADVLDIAKRMLAITYEYDAREIEWLEHAEVTVWRAELCYMRIREQHSIERALFVPAWAFYGDHVQHKQDGEAYFPNGSPFPGCLLVINAIDGSVIDPAQGY